MSWVSEYCAREDTEYFEELVLQTPQFTLGQLATVSLKRKKKPRTLIRGRKG